MSQEIELRTGRAFPTTRWSRILAAPADPDASREAFELLARRYWTPVAAFVRSRWARSDEDAHDATQDFFLWLFEGDLLARADASRGRFRAFIKTCLGNFLKDRERKRRTHKRGGHLTHVPLQGEGLAPIPAAEGQSPEDLLDDLWRRETLARATEDLQRELEEAGKQQAFVVFRDYYLEDEGLDHAAVAARHGLAVGDVSNRLAYAKQRFRACLRAVVLETVQSDEDLRAELSWLLEERAP